MVWDVLEFAAKHTEIGEKVALVSVTKTYGSSPASVGQLMAVLADEEICGTVGGGIQEHELITRAANAIKNGEENFTFSYSLAEKGMVCGGSVEGICIILGISERIVIFGGGHVAQALAPIARMTGFSVTVVEDREEFADAFEGAQYICCPIEKFAENIRLTKEDYVVVSTRGHRFDYQALKFALPFETAYLGMIGSKTKVKEVYEMARADGFSDEQLGRVYAPIGLNIGGQSPAEIALSILSEIQLVKCKGELAHKKI
ncbi:MAG: XdhC/CoxI family protein [Lachnospiraceae bacterium]|jgi:xanthine dehydrogenase accessory factor|nr:XdhC/CoxI family protein [Lachnospiraceae bacterium]